ncbi:MAG: signal peptidase I [Proteobacteria bacterium]|nr:signal peptidase I [Pseudomonadota bacterium]MBU4294525.1 signal peptidase I [Pseudomonadota bacterium]
MLGLGQISCGKIKRGIFIYVASLLLAATAVIICTKPFPPFNIVIPALIFIGLYVFAIVDAILIARDPENTLRLKPIVGYLVLIAIWQANSQIVNPIVAKTVKQNFIQAYKIPSGAMIPTLLIGDQILVDKHIYKNKEPDRGDIVIFPYPVKPEQDFIKRVVALGGDTIEIKEKQTYLNGKLLQEPYAIHKDPKIFPTGENQRDFYGPITVPTDSVFVMGDNRDNAYDSRFWGFVKKDTIKAKIINIYWSWDKEAGSVRWDRIGKPIL